MTKKICEVCEEESTCDFVKDYDHEVCCRCDRSVEINKNCEDCFDDYIGTIDIDDFLPPKKTISIKGVKL